MRRFAWAVPVMSVLPLACFSPGAPVTIALEGGVLPEIDFSDATAPLPDVSLPDSSAPALPEAGPPEAGPDAPPPPQPVQVKVVSDFGPESGVSIVAADGQGALLTTGAVPQTDAQGSVSLSVPAGGSVTAVLTSGSSLTLVTYVAVQPGDTLTFVDGKDVTFASVQANLGGNAAGVQGVLAGNCDTFFWDGPYTTNLSPGCYLEGLFPLLVEYNPNSDVPNNDTYVFKKGASLAALADGGTQLVVDLTGAAAYTDIGTQTVGVTKAPTTIQNAAFAFSEVANGVPYTQTNSFAIDRDGGTASAGFSTHPHYPDFVQSEVDMAPGAVGQSSRGNPYWSLARRAATATGQDTFDLSTLTPPTLSAGIAFTSSNVGIAWSTSAPIASAVGTFVALNGDGPQWFFVVPPGISSVNAPLPAKLGLSFSQGDLISWEVQQWASSAIAGYAALRSVAGPMVSLMASGSLQGKLPPLPVDGDVIVSGFSYRYSYYGGGT